MLTGRVLRFRAVARLHLNQRDYELIGGGEIDDEEGVVRGRYEHNVPADDVDALIFQTVLVTGYPSVCATRSAVRNPFHGQKYRYERHVDFGAHGKIAYQAHCWHEPVPDGLLLDSQFEVEGTINVPRLRPARRVSEAWTSREGKIFSTFEIEWPSLAGGDVVRGRATSVYELPFCAELPGTLQREITFPEATAAAHQLSIIQQSWLNAAEPS
jgi:hypothetical protein